MHGRIDRLVSADDRCGWLFNPGEDYPRWFDRAVAEEEWNQLCRRARSIALAATALQGDFEEQDQVVYFGLTDVQWPLQENLQ